MHQMHLMDPNKKLFQDFIETKTGLVLLGNDKACRVAGNGSIIRHLTLGQRTLINETRYVRELKMNLISIGMLDEQGYSISVINGTMKVCRGSMVVLKGKLINWIYILYGKNYIGTADVAIIDENTLWHKRLGHRERFAGIAQIETSWG